MSSNKKSLKKGGAFEYAKMFQSSLSPCDKKEMLKNNSQNGGNNPDTSIRLYDDYSKDWHYPGTPESQIPYAIDSSAGINEYQFGRPTPDNNFIVATGLVKNNVGIEMTGGKKKKKSSIGTMFKKVKSSSKKLVKKVKPYAEKAVKTVKSSSKKLVKKVKPYAEKAVKKVKSSSKKLVKKAKPIAKKAVKTVKSSSKKLVKKVKSSTTKKPKSSKKSKSVLNKTKNALKSVGKKVSSFF
jgi:hypothetical protein